MPGVQIPTLNRTPAPDQSSVGRIDYQGANPAAAEAQQTQSAESLIGSVDHYIRTQEAYSANTAALAAATEYHKGREDRLEGSPGDAANGIEPMVGAKQKLGDPAPIYQQLESDAGEHKQRILQKYDDASDVTKNAVAVALAGVDKKFADRQTTAYSSQSTEWTKSTTNAAAKMAQSDVLDSSVAITAEDPGSTKPLDESLKALSDIRAREGLKLGGATPIYDPEGKIDPATGTVKVVGIKNIAQPLLQTIAKEKSDALVSVVDNLLASNKIDEAHLILDKYSKSIDGLSRAKITEKLTKAAQEQAGSDAFNDVKDLPYVDALKKLNTGQTETMKNLGSEVNVDKVRQSAMSKLNTYRTQMENAKTAQARENFIQAGQVVLKQQLGGTPFVTKDQAYSDKRISPLLGKLTPEQVKAVGSLVEPPDKSTPEARANMYEILKNGATQLKGMSYDDFVLHSSGLNKTDRTQFESEYRKWNVETPVQQTQQMSAMNGLLEKEMEKLGQTDRELGIHKNQFGKYSEKDQIKLNNEKQKLYEQADKLPILSNKDQQSHVNSQIADLVKTKVYQPGFFENIYNKAKSYITPDQQKTTTPAPAPNTSKVNGVQPQVDDLKIKMDAVKRFQKQYGRLPDMNTTELSAFIKSGK